jgi:hypothetical protein
MKHWRIVIAIFVGLTLLGVFLPFIVTHYSLWLDLGRSDANEIGDTIGGILGPYFSFIGSCLVAYTIYLQIEQRKEDKLKDFEKVIFENCLDTLKNVERKIYNLNALSPDKSPASIFYINSYFKKEWNNETHEVHLLVNDINNALIFFNQNNIASKAYQLILISKIDLILELVNGSRLGTWNDTNRRINHFSTHFFKYPNPTLFTQVKVFYENIKTIKETFANKFNKDFQKKEVSQLKDTCEWINSIEPDFLEYWDLIFGEQEIAMPVGELEDKINIIRAKYNLPAKTYSELLGI